jgi:hypothetical protein
MAKFELTTDHLPQATQRGDDDLTVLAVTAREEIRS